MTQVEAPGPSIEKSNKLVGMRGSALYLLLVGFAVMSSATMCFAHSALPDPLLSANNSAFDAADLCIDLSIGNLLGAASDVYSSVGSLAASTNPADPNYKVIAIPVIPVVPPITPSATINAQTAIDEAALAQSKLAIGGYLLAASTSANRSLAAYNAGHNADAVEQYQYALMYLSEAGELQSQQIVLRLNLYNDLEAAGISSTVTADEISSLQQQIATSGLPASLTTQLTAYGLTASQIAAFTQEVAAVVPASTAGTYPDTLVSTSILANLAASSAEFSGIPILVNPATQGVINLASSAPITVVVPGSQTLDVSTLNVGVMHFGPAAARPLTSQISDYNGDGIPDLVLTFSTAATGVKIGDTVIGFYCYSTNNTGVLTNGSSPIVVQTGP